MGKRIAEHYFVSAVVSTLLFFFAAYPVLFGDEPLWAVLNRKGWVLTMPSWYYSFILILGVAVVALNVVLIRTVRRGRKEVSWLEALADEDSEQISHRIFVIEKSQSVTPFLDAINPYLILRVYFFNASVYTLTLQEEVEGRLTFNGHPLQDKAEIYRVKNPGQEITVAHGKYHQLELRQWLQSSVVDRIQQQGGSAEFGATNVSVYLTFQDRKGTSKRVRVSIGNLPFRLG